MKNMKSVLILLVGCVLLMGQSLFSDQVVLEASDDSWVNGNVQDANYGSGSDTRIRYQSYTGGKNVPLFKYDISELPANIEVTSVRMRFWTSLATWPGPTNFAPVAIFNNMQDWDELTVTYSNAPIYEANSVETLDHFGVIGSERYFTGTNTIEAGGWVEFQGAGTVALVQGWADGTIDNFGISMNGSGDFVSDGRTFRPQTKEHSTAAVHPEIIVNYTVIPTSTVVVDASADSWVSGNAKDDNFGTQLGAVLRYQSVTWGQNHSLYKFDLSALPANIEVTDVSMRFYSTLAAWPGPTNFATVAIFNNTQDWIETNVTYNTAPTYDATAADTLDHFGTTNAPVYFTGTNTITADATGWLEFQGAGAVALVQGWVDGTIDNYGITMWGTGDFVSDGRNFRPSVRENTTPALRPEIIIKYVVVPVTEGYAGWAGGWGVDIGAETNDYDADGLSNLYEFGLGGDPTNALDQGTAPTFGIADVGGINWFSYVYPQLSDLDSGLAYSLELNTDLVLGTWTNAGYIVTGTNVTGNALDFVTNVTDTTDNEKFIRLIIQ